MSPTSFKKVLSGWILLQIVIFFLTMRSIQSNSAAGQETLIGIVGHDFVLIGADSSSSTSIAITSSNVDKIRILINPFPNGSTESNSHTGDLDLPRQHAVLAASSGDLADSDRLMAFLAAHASKQEFEAGIGCDVECVYDGSIEGLRSPPFMAPLTGLDAKAVAYLTRAKVSGSMRSKNRLNVCLLVAGMVEIYQDKAKIRSKSEANSIESFSRRIRRQVDAADAEYELKSISSKSVNFKCKDSLRSQKHNDTLTPMLFWLDEYGSLQNLLFGAHGLGANFVLSILDRGYRTNMTREEAIVLMNECFRQLRTRYVINYPQPPCIKCVDATGCRVVG